MLAADHLIRDAAQFRQAINAGRKRRRGPPGDLRHRADGPGNRLRLHRSQRTLLPGGPVHVPIKRFVEKPDQATAEHFPATGRFTWNSGMFLFRASAMLAELERLAPEVGALPGGTRARHGRPGIPSAGGGLRQVPQRGH